MGWDFPKSWHENEGIIKQHKQLSFRFKLTLESIRYQLTNIRFLFVSGKSFHFFAFSGLQLVQHWVSMQKLALLAFML